MHLAQEGRRRLTPRLGHVPFDTMKFSTLPLLLTLAIAAACGGSGSTDTAEIATDTGAREAVLPNDAEILSKAYDNEYSVPDDFFVDERAATTRSYTVHHVLDESGSFEVCSDDLVAAQALEDADNAARAVTGYYITSYENDRYFEFVREIAYTEDVGNITEPTSPGYARVFKCGHTNRNGVDRALVDGYAGRLNPEPLNAGRLREFTEYLWQFTFFNVSRKKVIASYAQGSAMQHTLLLALVVNQGTDACDRIDVVAWRFSADPDSGEVTRQFETVRSFEATNAAGQPAFCE